MGEFFAREGVFVGGGRVGAVGDIRPYQQLTGAKKGEAMPLLFIWLLVLFSLARLYSHKRNTKTRENDPSIAD